MWRKIALGTLTVTVLLSGKSWGIDTKIPNTFQIEKQREYNLMLVLYAVGEYEWKLKKELIKNTAYCIKNAQDKAELQNCMENFKKGLKRIKESVELYSVKFLKELRRKE